MVSERIFSGSLTQGSIAHDINTEGTLSGSHVFGNEAFADGHNLRHYGQISRRVMIFPRPNTSDTTLVGGKPLGKIFDDGLSPNSARVNRVSKFSSWGFLQDSDRFGGFFTAHSKLIDQSTTTILSVPLHLRAEFQTHGAFNATGSDGLHNPGSKIYIKPTQSSEQAPGIIVFDVMTAEPTAKVQEIGVRYNPVFSSLTSVTYDPDTPGAYDTGVFYSANSLFRLGSRGKITQVISHEIEQRDLGYVDLYDDGLPFREHTNPANPAELLRENPLEVYFPITMADPGSTVSMNGVLEPLGIRSNVDISNVEIPFTIRGLRVSTGIDEDVYRKSVIPEDGYDDTNSGVVPYLDAVEYFHGVELPPVFETDDKVIESFSDTSHMRELYFTKNAKRGISVSDDFRKALIKNGFDTSDFDVFDHYGSTGADYFDVRTDSIAFGGLKK